MLSFKLTAFGRLSYTNLADSAKIPRSHCLVRYTDEAFTEFSDGFSDGKLQAMNPAIKLEAKLSLHKYQTCLV